MGGVLTSFHVTPRPEASPVDPWALHRLLWEHLVGRLDWELSSPGCRAVFSHYMLEEYEDHYGSEADRPPDAAPTRLLYRLKDHAGTCAISMSTAEHWFTRMAAMHHRALAKIAAENGYTLHQPEHALATLHAKEQTVRVALRGSLYEIAADGSLLSDEGMLAPEGLTPAEQAQASAAIQGGRCRCDLCRALSRRIRCHRADADIFRDLDGTASAPEQVLRMPEQTPTAPLSPALAFDRVGTVPWAYHAAFSPDGSQLALGGEAGRLEVRDGQGATVLWHAALDARASVIVGYDRSGALIATQYFDGRAHVMEWRDPLTGSVTTRREVRGDVCDWALHPTSPWLAVPRWAADIKLLHLETGEEIQPVDAQTGLRLHRGGRPHRVQFSADGRWLFSGPSPCWVRDVRTGRVRLAFSGASDARLHPTDPDLIAVARHGALVLHRLTGGWAPEQDAVLLPTSMDNPYIGQLSWSPDGAWLLSAWGGGQVFSVAQRRWLGALPADEESLALVASPDRAMLVSIGDDGARFFAIRPLA